MNNNNLARIAVAASFVTLVGTVALAQQAGGGPQPQTRSATTPAEVTPSHPLNSTTGPRTGTATTTGTAPTQGAGQSQGNNATSTEKK